MLSRMDSVAPNRGMNAPLLLAAGCLPGLSGFSQPLDWIWAKRVGGPDEYDRGVEVATGKTGDCYVAGVFTSPTLTLTGRTNSMTLANGDNQWNVFPAKYSPAGELVWAQGIGGITIPLTLSSAVSVSAMAIDGADNLCLTGGFWHSAVFGTSNAVTFSSPEGTEVLYVAKFASDGTFIWAQQGQGLVPCHGDAVRVNQDGRVYVAGTFGVGEAWQDLILGAGEECGNAAHHGPLDRVPGDLRLGRP